MPGDAPADGGRGVSVWASALPVSKANPSAAIADDLIVFIVLLPVGDFRAAKRSEAPVSRSSCLGPPIEISG
jgi:hypothetical protein